MFHSNHMTRQQEIRNPLLDSILVLAAPANQLATLHAGLHEKRVQILQSLRRLVVVGHQNFGLGDHVWKTGQAELCGKIGSVSDAAQKKQLHLSLGC
jgi:hypothetical protein